MKKYFVFAILLAPFLLFSRAEAYEVVETKAMRVTDNHVIFTVSFKMGFLNRTLLLPMLTHNDPKLSNKEINFEIRDSADKVSHFKTHSVILATKSTIKDKVHYLPEKKNDIFTFLTIAEIPKSEMNYHLVITRLPFLTLDNEGTARLSFIDSESIKTFKTETIK